MNATRNTIDRSLLERALRKMEEVEYSSLVWGSVDGGFTRDQLLEKFSPLLEEVGDPDPEDGADELIEKLIDCALVCECNTISGIPVFRSRFAEGIRLLARLRQLFPRNDWRVAPSLVSDFRVDLRPRRYPRRDQCPQTAREMISEKTHLSAVAIKIWDKLVPADGSFPLAGFQVRAAESVLMGEAKGTIITAGTSSGKTLAFYLPALIRIVELLSSKKAWTKCLAVYPRVELLKDQFSEALAMCAHIAGPLKDSGRRPITIGTLFKDTPYRAENVEKKWQEAAILDGVICPYSNCPIKDCDGDLVWLREDIKNSREKLVCQECGETIEEDSIILTRRRGLQTPPDILFTTMEMLHKRLADPEYFKMLGVGVDRPNRIPFVLLDEVHTYAGLPGAQGAMVLRRWKQAAQADPTFVGLSATLLEAKLFFHELTGLPEHSIDAISATEQEMLDEGAEYQLILKGNPASQTSLLSTSIQAGMLLSRLMDPISDTNGVSEGFYGSRVFAFTDNLDVNTRLHDDLRDAEGLRTHGGRRPPLAALRASQANEPNPQVRELEGQRWRLPEQIGHQLNQSLEVGRTSSRDPGVARNMNLIVATASLEVGYNDNAVGAVMQHKAPMDFAAYLQRKGRGGRKRGMRPWTVTTLTAFGRDRLAFQHYHQLFEPTLQRQHLPIRNLYLIRMQALCAFFDWLALEWRGQGNLRGWLWNALATPIGASYNKDLCDFVITRLDELLAGMTPIIDSMSKYIRSALVLTDDEVESVLYAPPRSLLFEALPTLHRRLTTQWQNINGLPNGRPSLDNHVDYLPLPEFVAPNLFTQLALPEVTIDIEGRPRTESMPVFQALREVIPGRVTRRFAEHNARVSHWVSFEVDELLKQQQVSEGCRLRLSYPLNRYIQSTQIGDFPLPDGTNVSVYEPFRMRLESKRERRVSNMSNSWPVWQSHIFTESAPLRYTPAKRSKWHRVVSSLDCYIHAHRGAVTVRRFATGASTSMRIGTEKIAADIIFVDDEKREVALGMEFDTDGIAVRYRLPLAEQIAVQPMSQELKMSIRRAYFRDKVVNDPELNNRLTGFQLEWLQQIYLATVIAWATVTDISLEEAHTTIRNRTDTKPFERAMMVVIGFQDEVEADADGPPLLQELTELMANQTIMDRLHELGETLYLSDKKILSIWLRNRLHENMALAVQEACIRNVPKYATMGTLMVDPDPLDSDSESAVIWVSEDTLGGSGVMEALADRIAENPSILLSGIEAYIAPTDQELTAMVLERVVRLAISDPTLADLLAGMRAAVHHEERSHCHNALNERLREHGILLSKSASVALNSRLLRPGTQPGIDALIIKLIEHWDQLQSKLGIALGLQEFCALVGLDKSFRPHIKAIVPPSAQINDRDVAAQLYGILWPRQHEARQEADVYQPFRKLSSLNEPKLISDLMLKGLCTDVKLSDTQPWLDQVLQALGRSETCRLITGNEGQKQLAQAVAELLLTPVDIGYLQFFPTVERYEQGVDYHAAIITIWEDI